jgi:hypothetical protein
MPEIKDFTKKRKPLQFKVDDDLFDAVPTIPADTMIEFAESMSSADPTKMTPAEMVGALRRVIEMVLMPESLARFKARMKNQANPIDMEQLDEVVTWLFEEYGMRPTQELPSSLAGGSPVVPGITSTATLPDVVSISAASPSTVS